MMWPAALLPLKPIDLLRVPFLAKGADMAGWDCVGCARFLTRTAFGVEVKSFDDQYTGTDWEDVPALEAAIAREVGRFTPCEPQFGAWLLFRRFGRECHIGWAIDAKTFVHAEDSGPVKGSIRTLKGGGTYIGNLADEMRKGVTADTPNGRFVGAFLP